MFDKSKDTQQSLNDAAKSVDEAAQEVTKQMSKFDQTVDSVKAHIRENKRTYLVAAGMFGAGVLVRSRPEVKQVIGSFNVMWKSEMTNVVVTQVARRGHPGYMIINNVTGEVAASIRRMAEVDGKSATFIRDHLKGNTPIYTIIGEAA